jgi:hypothetical protein
MGVILNHYNTNVTILKRFPNTQTTIFESMNAALNRVYFSVKGGIIVFYVTQLVLFSVANSHSHVVENIRLFSLLCWYISFTCMLLLVEITNLMCALRHVWNGYREMVVTNENLVMQIILNLFQFGLVLGLCGICLRPANPSFECYKLSGQPLCLFIKGLLTTYAMIVFGSLIWLIYGCCKSYMKVPDGVLRATRYTHDTGDCCICLTSDTGIWVKTECLHVYHESCLKSWSNYNSTCPTCRTLILK